MYVIVFTTNLALYCIYTSYQGQYMTDHAKQQKVEQPSKREMQPSQEAQLEPQASPEIYSHTSNVVELQRYVGNSGVQRMLKNGSIQPMPQHRFLTKQPSIQRDPPASPDAAP